MAVTADADRDRRQAAARAGVTEVVVEETRWLRLIPAAKSLVRRAARIAGGIDTVVLGSDRLVQRLNWRHRGRNEPTNVLTFAPGDGGAMGGEIVLACGVVMREAAAAKRAPAHHLAHLVVHGALHLRGFDHHHPGDAKRMEMTEARLLHRLRVANPWSNR